MNKPTFFVGIDISANEFTASVFSIQSNNRIAAECCANGPDGFESLHRWFCKRDIVPNNTILCVDTNNVHGDQFCSWFMAGGYRVAMGKPLYLKSIFNHDLAVQDLSDSRRFVEYAYSLDDKLNCSVVRTEIIEQISALLTTRDELEQQKAAHIMALKNLENKTVQAPLAIKCHRDNIEHLDAQINEIETEFRRLLDEENKLQNSAEFSNHHKN